MATITFEITGLKEKALVRIANQYGKTPSEYAAGIVDTFLNDQVRGFYLKKFNQLTTVEIVRLFGDLT